MLSESPFLGEGHRKVKVRLAAKGIRAGKNRVLRLMRAHGLLAPVRQGHPRGDRSHSGRIRTERPDKLWGTGRVAVLDESRGLVLVLRSRRPLRLGRRRLARGEEGRPLGGAGAGPPGRPGPHGRLRQGHRPGAVHSFRASLALAERAAATPPISLTSPTLLPIVIDEELNLAPHFNDFTTARRLCLGAQPALSAWTPGKNRSGEEARDRQVSRWSCTGVMGVGGGTVRHGMLFCTRCAAASADPGQPTVP